MSTGVRLAWAKWGGGEREGKGKRCLQRGGKGWGGGGQGEEWGRKGMGQRKSRSRPHQKAQKTNNSGRVGTKLSGLPQLSPPGHTVTLPSDTEVTMQS